MDFNEAQELLKNSGFRIITEMAKAARNRILDRLTPKKKAIYILGRFFEKNGDNVSNCTYKSLQKYVDAKEIVTGLNWETFKSELGINVRSTNPHIGNTNIPSINSANSTMYNAINTQIERSKDNIDRDYVDKIYNYYNDVKNGKAPQAAYDEYDLGPAIEWLKSDEAEAADRFGVKWDSIKQALRRWWDSEFSGTDAEAFEIFLDWYRAKKNHQELPELSDETKAKLVNIALTDGAEETYGNYIWVLRRNATEWLGQTLEEYQNEHTPAESEAAPEYDEELQAEIQRIIDSINENDEPIATPGDDEETDDAHGRPDIEFQNDGTIRINHFVIPEDIISILHDLAGNAENVDTRAIGHASKEQVIDCYKYCLNSLNKQFHVGRNGIYTPGIQAFYNTFKKVFKTGFITPVMYTIFERISTYLKNKLEHKVQEYWNNVANIEDVDDFNIDEAIKILSRCGYNIIKD